MNKLQASAPIGVFDSGLGGLTVLSALREAMPHESFVYLGDLARLPYGNKSSAVVNAYSQNCFRLLERYGVKLLVVACNTATALALEPLRQQTEVPVVGVIEGGVRAALQNTSNQKVLVLATESTVRNEAYLREFNRQNFKGQVQQVACPLLVPLAEEGWWDNDLTASVIRHYLAQAEASYAEPVSFTNLKPLALSFDTVVLGCTHYPLLEPSFQRVLPEGVKLVHGGRVVAEQVRDILRSRTLLAGVGSEPKMTFLSTDSVSGTLPLIKFHSTLGRVAFEPITLC